MGDLRLDCSGIAIARGGRSWGMGRILYFWGQQVDYMNGHFSIWGFGEHHMVEYLLYGTRRIPMEYEKKPETQG